MQSGVGRGASHAPSCLPRGACLADCRVPVRAFRRWSSAHTCGLSQACAAQAASVSSKHALPWADSATLGCAVIGAHHDRPRQAPRTVPSNLPSAPPLGRCVLSSASHWPPSPVPTLCCPAVPLNACLSLYLRRALFDLCLKGLYGLASLLACEWPHSGLAWSGIVDF